MIYPSKHPLYFQIAKSIFNIGYISSLKKNLLFFPTHSNADQFLFFLFSIFIQLSSWKYCVITAYWWPSFIVLVSSMVGLSEARSSCHHWCSEPNSVSLIWIVKHLNINRFWLYKIFFTLILAFNSYPFNL